MPIVGLSHPRAITRVPDPIHGVIELNVFDRDIVDSRAFQRLHFVLQQSVSYTSFPANKNTRFPHSLGTAHTVGRMFAAALSNAEPDTLRDFLNDAADFLLNLIPYVCGGDARGLERGDADEGSVKRAISAHGFTISGASGFRHSALPADYNLAGRSKDWRVGANETFGTHNGKDNNHGLKAEFIVDTVWQALRLYALTHDIGHLPMSHAFENAIAGVPLILKENFSDRILSEKFKELDREARLEFSGVKETEEHFFQLLQKMIGANREPIETMIQGKDLHEVRSFAILNALFSDGPKISEGFPSLPEDDQKKLDDYAKLINNLSLCIVYSPLVVESAKSQQDVHSASFLYAARRLIDGAIDGDRLDYTLRDCHAAGTRFGDFDLERIVRNSILLKKKIPEMCHDKKHLHTPYAIGFGPHAISGIEQFFEARYQSYKYLVHHRTASRSNIAVEALVSHLFAYATRFQDSDCAKLMNQFGYIELDNNDKLTKVLPIVTKAIEQIDDCSLRMLLHLIRNHFKSNEENGCLTAGDERAILEEKILALIEVVLFRDFSHIVTLFRHMTIDGVLNEKLGLKEEGITKFGTYIEADLAEFFAALRRKILAVKTCEIPPSTTLMYELAKPKVFELVDEKNLAFEKTVWIRDTRGNKLPLGDPRISVSLSGMAEQRKSDKKLRLYASGTKLRSNPQAIEKIEEIVIDTLKEWHTSFLKRTAKPAV